MEKGKYIFIACIIITLVIMGIVGYGYYQRPIYSSFGEKDLIMKSSYLEKNSRR